MQKSKMAVLQIAVKRREVKSKGEKERYKHLNAEFRLKLNKVGKTTRPYGHDLNKIPYD